MALYRRGRVWWLDVQTPSGQRIRRSTGTDDRTLAEEYHDHLKVSLWRAHRLGEKPRRTWQDAVVRWVREKDSKADHGKDLAKLRWLDQHFGGLYLDEISLDTIDQVGLIKKSESTPATANRYLALVRAILRAARDDWEWIDRCPRVRLYSEPRKRVRYLSRAEADVLLSELPPHLADMAEFSLATGLRQRNVSYLRWDQVDVSRRMAWIHADQSKSGKAIAVPLNRAALSVLTRRLEKHPEWVFTYRDNPVDRTSTKAWKSALSRAGIKDFRWHDLRHTWASWHVQNGTSLQELQALGGWSSFEMVLRYAHLAADHLQAAACRIDDTPTTQSVQHRGLRLVTSQ
ncbi:MAG: site-specific integrase [Pseudomonadota bacterium]